MRPGDCQTGSGNLTIDNSNKELGLRHLVLVTEQLSANLTTQYISIKNGLPL